MFLKMKIRNKIFWHLKAKHLVFLMPKFIYEIDPRIFHLTIFFDTSESSLMWIKSNNERSQPWNLTWVPRTILMQSGNSPSELAGPGTKFFYCVKNLNVHFIFFPAIPPQTSTVTAT